MPQAYVSLAGHTQLLKTLKALPLALQKKSLRTASRNAAKIVQKDFKGKAPKGNTGHLSTRAQIRAMKRRQWRVGVTIGSNTAAWKGDHFYLAFVELGHHVGKRKGGHHKRVDLATDKRRWIEGTHTLQNALEQNVSPIEQIFIKELQAQLDKVRAK